MVSDRHTFPINPQNPRRPGKGIEHDRDPPIARLMQMTRRLNPTSRQIHIPKLTDHDILVGFLAVLIAFIPIWRRRRSSFAFLDDAEEGPAFIGVCDALGRDIDVSFAREGRRGDVEDFLLEEPLDQGGRDCFEELPHLGHFLITVVILARLFNRPF